MTLEKTSVLVSCKVASGRGFLSRSVKKSKLLFSLLVFLQSSMALLPFPRHFSNFQRNSEVTILMTPQTEVKGCRMPQTGRPVSQSITSITCKYNNQSNNCLFSPMRWGSYFFSSVYLPVATFIYILQHKKKLTHRKGAQKKPWGM